ncbi:MAG TPA: DUF1707 domain-containing protein [Micromonosporaceae bacterium]|nr:DUF1707 domain-containing protein [Micromonosporaceae bacterium]
MDLGWSNSGQGPLRATNNDRKAVLRLLDLGQDEGRLDAVEHARRVDAVEAATTRGDLARLAADLPSKRGMTDWIDAARVRGDDRERAAQCLTHGMAQGRLAPGEYEQRVTALAEVATYAALKGLLDGLPGWPGADEKNLLAGTADRQRSLAMLAEAVTDGRISASEPFSPGG